MNDNLVLEHLRHIRAKVDSMDGKIDSLTLRMTRLESAMVSIKRDMADGFEADMRLQASDDRIMERLERIERRLDLTD